MVRQKDTCYIFIINVLNVRKVLLEASAASFKSFFLMVLTFADLPIAKLCLPRLKLNPGDDVALLRMLLRKAACHLHA